MELLVDKTAISRLNELSTEDQRKLIMQYASKNGVEIFFGNLKKKQLDRKNFHILAENGTLLQRQEVETRLDAKVRIIWSVRVKNSQKIEGNFGQMVDAFNNSIIGG